MRKSLQICGLYKELLDAFHTIELLQRSCKVSVIIIIILLIFQIKELGFREVNGLAQRHTAACGAGGGGWAEGTRTHIPWPPIPCSSQHRLLYEKRTAAPLWQLVWLRTLQSANLDKKSKGPLLLTGAPNSRPRGLCSGMEGLKKGLRAEFLISLGRAQRLLRILSADLMP